MPVLSAFDNVELPLLLTSLSRRDGASASRPRWRWWGSRTGWSTIRTSFPAASSSASRSRGR